MDYCIKSSFFLTDLDLFIRKLKTLKIKKGALKPPFKIFQQVNF